MSRMRADELQVGDKVWSGREQTIKEIKTGVTNFNTGDDDPRLLIEFQSQAVPWLLRPEYEVNVRNR